MNVTVTREAADGLSRTAWVFWFKDRSMQLVLDSYQEATRPSKRHGWRVTHSRSWSRLLYQRYHLPRKEVPLPDDVVAEALQQFRNAITYAVD